MSKELRLSFMIGYSLLDIGYSVLSALPFGGGDGMHFPCLVEKGDGSDANDGK